MNAIEIIQKSVDMHPTLFIESLQTRAWEDSKYAATRESAAIKRPVMASFNATMRAIDHVKNDNVSAFRDDMGAGIIALNIACKLQCIPPHVRTSVAVDLWEESQ